MMPTMEEIAPEQAMKLHKEALAKKKAQVEHRNQVLMQRGFSVDTIEGDAY